MGLCPPPPPPPRPPLGEAPQIPSYSVTFISQLPSPLAPLLGPPDEAHGKRPCRLRMKPLNAALSGGPTNDARSGSSTRDCKTSWREVHHPKLLRQEDVESGSNLKCSKWLLHSSSPSKVPPITWPTWTHHHWLSPLCPRCPDRWKSWFWACTHPPNAVAFLDVNAVAKETPTIEAVTVGFTLEDRRAFDSMPFLHVTAIKV